MSLEKNAAGKHAETFLIARHTSLACLAALFFSSDFVLGAASVVSIPLNVYSERIKDGHVGAAKTMFERLSVQETGIDLIQKFPANATLEALQDQRSGSGVCIGDYDADGWPDIYVSNYDRGNRLYRNLGDWRFQDVTVKAGVTGEGRWCGGVTFVDIDGDQDLDLFVCVFNAPNLLYVNQGDGTFREEAKKYGLDFAGASVMMAFADYDRDGDLDGYLVTARLAMDSSQGLPRSAKEALQRGTIRLNRKGDIQVPAGYQELFATIEKPNGRSELIIAGQADRFYRNDGNGHFEEISGQIGIVGRDIGLAATWWDYNDDGFPDLYVSNDYKGPDRLYRNNNGRVFEEVTRAALPAVPYASMGSDIADVNNDGRLDLLATDMAGSTRAREVMNYSDLERDVWFLRSAEPRQYRRNMLYINSGTDRFMEAARLANIASTDWTWSPKFGDFDNDGLIDLFIANGMSRDFVNRDIANQTQNHGENSWFDTPVLLERNFAFRNRGDLQFDNVSEAWGLDILSASYGASLADLDRDGDLDLVVSNFNEALAVFRNQERSNSRVLIRLKGTQSNSWGLGAKVILQIGSAIQVQYLTLARGFMSANEPLIHFGCEKARKIDRLTVLWPSSPAQVLQNLDTDRFYTITEPVSVENPHIEVKTPTTMFRRSDLFAGIRHRERDFNDFARQPLLPLQMSQLGPGLAFGDVDGDRREDFYLCGAAGYSGMLFVRQKNGAFARRPQQSFENDSAYEDMGALFFDADGDGDLDLYVVSGGVECEPGSELLQDRLYLNDGKGDFTRAPKGVLPELRHSGSVVCAADFDRDGDLDLFVGGRSIPGRYPEVPESMLLRNEGGHFVDVADQIAPGLKHAGLVTSALWSDADNDGWLDLLLTREWGSVMLFRNRNGKFEDASQAAGLAGLTGLWNSISGSDLDHDGDIDYVVGNRGLNTGYEATPTHPAILYYGDLEGRGQVDLLEARYEGEALFPIRGKTTLTAALPSLFARISTFAEFGAVTLPQVLGPPFASRVARLEARCLESGVLINDGRGHLNFKPLPRVAQVAPAFGLVVTELDGDGHPDIYITQNFSGPRVETGRMNAGISLLLKGKGDGSFLPISPAESGLVIDGDGRALASIDLNEDGWPDLVLAQNNGPVSGFINTGNSSNQIVSVQLLGRKGNPGSVGARIEATGSDRSSQTAEIYGGGGYLSQSSPVLHFGFRAGQKCAKLIIRWPDGLLSTHNTENAGTRLTIRQLD